MKDEARRSRTLHRRLKLRRRLSPCVGPLVLVHIFVRHPARCAGLVCDRTFGHSTLCIRIAIAAPRLLSDRSTFASTLSELAAFRSLPRVGSLSRTNPGLDELTPSAYLAAIATRTSGRGGISGCQCFRNSVSAS